MAIILTTDVDVVIEEIQDGPPKRIVYRDLVSGERWAEIGECNQCGLCEIGSSREEKLIWDITKRRGEPGSCSDPEYGKRPEIVNRPSIKENARIMAEELGIDGGGCSYDFESLEQVK